MEFDAFLHEALPPLGYNWRPHRRRAVRKKVLDRLRALHLCRLEDYLQLLHDSAEEQDYFEHILPVTVSRFFRNHEYFAYLRDQIFPDLVQRFHPPVLKVWSIGSASGEEPYSIAMVWDYWFAARYPFCRLQICATEVDPAMIARAERGIYAASSLKEVPDALRARYFAPTDRAFALHNSIKAQVEWHQDDIRHGPDLMGNHLIFCCYSGFTYFSSDIRCGLIDKLTFALRPGGYLVLGKKDHFPATAFEHFCAVAPPLQIYQQISE